ncbi:hypothetical protein YTPLAS73_03030 [Nitrosarchaeum sp.]|nr:hypothetical protein YTPLAS73_03030 [Nitrosarchaeum sp.]
MYPQLIQENLKQSLQKIPDSIPDTIIDSIPSSIELPIQELAGKAVHTIKRTSEEITNYADEIGQPAQTTKEESQNALDYINELRTQNGRQTITWDSRVFSLASAWSQELYETRQFDHTNPVTGNCPATLKSQYGLSSNEDVADNLHATGYGYNGQDQHIFDNKKLKYADPTTEIGGGNIKVHKGK